MPARRRDEHHGTFGPDAFGRAAEHAARFFGTPQYIIGQTIAVVVWIALNSIAIVQHWDPYPFILLNLAFSTQAAYAAPLILLAQTRQAERDKKADERAERRHNEMEKLDEADDPRVIRLDPNDVERLFLAAHLDPAALADGEVNDSAVSAEHLAV